MELQKYKDRALQWINDNNFELIDIMEFDQYMIVSAKANQHKKTENTPDECKILICCQETNLAHLRKRWFEQLLPWKGRGNRGLLVCMPRIDDPEWINANLSGLDFLMEVS